MKYFIFWIIIFSSTITFSQENLKAGDQVPEFKFWLTNGSKLTKNDIQNKVVVFKFWFTSCLSCLEDTSLLNDLVDVYKEKKIFFL
ncbi:TlpA family protein disulfide reductase [Tenacibaculum sp. ZS6-P6]|uniref:TlpA family protein disulfide reductase n=1 Tax=Tenacibaculum sp. ZS6-P6 TaxID=3447503 RepID=UPI003F9A40AE